MARHPSQVVPAVFAVLFLVSLSLIVLAPHGVSAPTVNQLPEVEILIPVEGQTVPYRIQAQWWPRDMDGLIDHSQYALNPPPEFSEEEIGHPENFPSLTIEVVPGPGPNQDTLRVFKEVDGDTVSFDWIQTPRADADLVLETPNPDSTFNGKWWPLPSYSGPNTLYVRAVDDSAGISDPDRVSVTAENRTPIAAITRPNIYEEFLTVGPTLRIDWDGTDPDGPSPGKPVGYLYKLLRLDTLNPPIPILNVTSPDILFTHGGPWNLTDSLTVTLNLDTPGQYLFGVRAVDENGGEEPFLDFSRNAFKFQAFPDGGKPLLVLREAVLGSFEFTGIDTMIGGQIISDIEFVFEVECSGEDYGGICESMRWGVDLDSLEAPGWSGWTGIFTLPPLIFGTGEHSLTVQIRDDLGATTTGTLLLEVIEFAFDREVLFVDDSFDDAYPRDNEHDQFWADRFADSGRFDPAQVFTHEVHGDLDRERLDPLPPTLAELGRYRLVVWECRGSGYNGTTALLKSSALAPTLGTYLRAGGQLWLGGRMTVAATIPASNMVNANLFYPKDLTSHPGNFAHDFLKLRSNWIDNDKGSNEEDVFARAMPFPGAFPFYEEMSVDVTKLNLAQKQWGGFTHADAVFNPIFAHQEPGFRGLVDSIYAYGAAGNLVQGKNSVYHNRLCAVRWHDPDPDSLHGRTQWFGFSLYYMNDNEAQETFNRSIDWFRGITVPVRLTRFSVERSGTAGLLSWTVAGSSDDLSGFHVYREERGGGERVRLTDRPLTGRFTYEYADLEAPPGGADYWLAELDRSGQVRWHGPRNLPPAATTRPVVTLSPNVPNPFASRTRIMFSLPEERPVTLIVYDVQGRRVATLLDDVKEAGDHTAFWDGRGEDGTTVAAGFYILRLTAGTEVRIQKMVLTR